MVGIEHLEVGWLSASAGMQTQHSTHPQESYFRTKPSVSFNTAISSSPLSASALAAGANLGEARHVDEDAEEEEARSVKRPRSERAEADRAEEEKTGKKKRMSRGNQISQLCSVLSSPSTAPIVIQTKPADKDPALDSIKEALNAFGVQCPDLKSDAMKAFAWVCCPYLL